MKNFGAYNQPAFIRCKLRIKAHRGVLSNLRISNSLRSATFHHLSGERDTLEELKTAVEIKQDWWGQLAKVRKVTLARARRHKDGIPGHARAVMHLLKSAIQIAQTKLK